VSTPAYLNRFIRGYVGGRLFGSKIRPQQRKIIEGGARTRPARESTRLVWGSSATGRAAGRYGATRGTSSDTPSLQRRALTEGAR
jgi:hypothetical protein